MRLSLLSLALTGSLATAAVTGCGTAKPGGMNGPTINNRVGPPPQERRSPVVSWDILDREPVANTTHVRHILIGWADLAEAYQGGLDPRAEKRNQRDAENAVKGLLGQLKAGGDFVALMGEHSEDRGSATGGPMTVTPDAQLVIEFRQLSLRLEPGEFGVCQSDYGFHIIRREP
ncbi:MAG: peptidylprolyl isomerase [Kofleriaceae bacterium]|jgi:hypothetical protein|nr:peptidylprolyl isomerase [Kofleriaceae bacterium]MBP6839797.1 peptidylprolyl isomerase [Kofleriaceae bacterium]MBP9207454.1 peptidylprolyl isomerase [Kofleriaceae bacterium]